MAACLKAVAPELKDHSDWPFWWENVYTLKYALKARPELKNQVKGLLKRGRLGAGAEWAGMHATLVPAREPGPCGHAGQTLGRTRAGLRADGGLDERHVGSRAPDGAGSRQGASGLLLLYPRMPAPAVFFYILLISFMVGLIDVSACLSRTYPTPLSRTQEKKRLPGLHRKIFPLTIPIEPC